MFDYNVKLIQFPTNKVGEAVVENEDGSYTIFINSSFNKDRQVESFKHAVEHILGDDFSKLDVNSIEYYAHSA